MTARKTLRIIAIFILIVVLALGANALIVRAERNYCDAWQDHPELWVEWRIKQCQQLGVPLPVSQKEKTK